ncbi:MAG: response regulator transcription factor [Actinobacteria bacterium]|nr:response regulator transcription factor [Actinomycetota bacterium]
MTGIDEKDLKEGAPLYKLNRKQAFPAKVIIGIIRPEQIDFAAENTPDLDDIIFPDRLKKELLPRIVFSLTKSNAALPDNSIIVNKLILNLDKYELIVNGKVVELTFKEFELLKILMQNSNRVFTRINLLSSVWGYDFYGGSRTVDVHMRRLRAKIPPPYNDMLKTIRNVGYMFSPENE